MDRKRVENVKEKTLKMFEERRGTAVSGEQLAAGLGVSRAAVWKAVESLRKEGYDIAATTNRGYTLSTDSDILSAQGIVPFLDSGMFPNGGKNIFVYKELESTNETAKQKAFKGAAHGTVILAEGQTGGKGRLGRSFFSPAGTGLYMSLIIKPDFASGKSLLITTAASVAVCRAIKKTCGIDTQIKWVNDILFEGRKVCGILTEAISSFESGQIEAAIVGIGINCNTKIADMPEEIRETAGTLPTAVLRNRLAAEIINEFMLILSSFSENSYPEYMDEYRRRSIVLRKDINVYNGATGEYAEAKAIDISNDGGLIVIYRDGRKETLNSGEISIRVK